MRTARVDLRPRLCPFESGYGKRWPLFSKAVARPEKRHASALFHHFRMASASATAPGCVRWRCTRSFPTGSQVPLGTHAAKRASRPQRVSTKTCVKRGTWGYPEFSAGGDDDRADKSDSVSLNLDADDASETGMDPPSAGVQSFEHDRTDGMPKMPPSTIEMQNPGKWSPIAYAFLGDAVWELYVRRLFFAPPTRPLEYDLKCKRAVKAEAQDVILRMLLANNIFTGKESWVVVGRKRHRRHDDVNCCVASRGKLP